MNHALYPLASIIDIDVNLQNALISTNDILGIANTSLWMARIQS